MFDHWESFAYFCKREIRTGGPDPQIATLQQILSVEPSLQSRIWMIGCYGAHHCVPSAYVVWSFWKPKHVLTMPKEFRFWLKRHWDGLPVRPEMRSHRMLDKREYCLRNFAKLAIEYDPGDWPTYDDAWTDSQNRVKYYGRYMAIKVLEMFRRFGDSPHLALQDMRAKDGWSPRVALSLLWNDPSLKNRNDQSDRTLRTVERVFRKTRLILAKQHSVMVSLFQLQVLLCEYKEALAGGYYPGASLDEELIYIAQSQAHFTDVSFQPIFDARKDTFREKHLGEIGGWEGTRPERFTPFKAKRDA